MPSPLSDQPDPCSTPHATGARPDALPSGPRRPSRYRRSAAGFAALVLMTAGLSLPALALPVLLPAAQASPVEPGIGGSSEYPLCPAPQAAPGLPGWSRVTCGAGAHAGSLAGLMGGSGSSSLIPWILQPGIPVEHSTGNRGNGSITVTYHAPPISCGSLVYASTTLTTNLDCRGTTGLTVGGDELDQSVSTGIVLNLGGHTILGDAGEVGIDLDQSGITVRNGTLRGFGTGISVHDLTGDGAGPGGPDATSVLSHLHLTHGGVGIGLDGAAFEAYTLTSVDHTVIDTMSGGAIAGDRRDDPMAGSLDVTDSTLRDSAFGVDTTVASTTFEHDTVTGNAGPAFIVATGYGGAVLVDNTVTGNGSGISVTTPGEILSPSYPPVPSTVTITGNTVTGNGGSGIRVTGSLDPAYPGVVANNLVGHNGRSAPAGDPGDGLLVDLSGDAGGLTVSGNSALFNGGWGIDAVGVTDGGGDLATGNAAGADCRGVACAAAG